MDFIKYIYFFGGWELISRLCLLNIYCISTNIIIIQIDLINFLQIG